MIYGSDIQECNLKKKVVASIWNDVARKGVWLVTI